VVRGLREWHVGDGRDNGHKPAASYAPASKIPEHHLCGFGGADGIIREPLAGGRHTWEIQHNRSYGVRHLEASGDLPPKFAGFRDVAMDKQRSQEESRGPGEWSVDYVFDVPLDTAAMITGYRYGRVVEDDFFRNLRTLLPTSQPPKW